MAWSFKRWALEKLGGDAQRVSVEAMTGESFFELAAELYVRDLAFWSCVNLVANAVSKCEFKTFLETEEIKGAEYYLWNVEPNLNQNSSSFLHKLVAKLYSSNEVLVVEHGGQLLVADSFTRKPYVLYEDVFTQVQVDDFTFARQFAQSEVLYLQLNPKAVRPIVNGLYAAYQKLIAYAMRSYQKSRGTKGVLELDTMGEGDQKFQDLYTEIKNTGFKTFAAAENAVLPLWKGMEYTEIGSKTYSNEGTRDIRAMIDDVSDFTAKAFGIPPALLRGDVQGTADALDQFLTFCIDPLCDMLREEINRKRSGPAGMLAGTYVQIETNCIKHVDLLSVATAIDKLIASGAFCINDVRRMTGATIIDEPWAWKHWITKNYQEVQALLTEMLEQDPKTG